MSSKWGTMAKLTALVVALALGAMACASATVIRTRDPGATVYADGQYLGVTPVQYSDTKIIGSTTRIEL